MAAVMDRLCPEMAAVMDPLCPEMAAVMDPVCPEMAAAITVRTDQLLVMEEASRGWGHCQDEVNSFSITYYESGKDLNCC